LVVFGCFWLFLVVFGCSLIVSWRFAGPQRTDVDVTQNTALTYLRLDSNPLTLDIVDYLDAIDWVDNPSW